MRRKQNIFNRMRPKTNVSLVGRDHCIYHRFDFDNHFKNDQFIINKGDRFFDFDEECWKVKE